MNSNWTRFNSYLYKYWKLQAAVILLGLITVPLSLVNPYLTKLIIDKAYGDKDLKLFFILAVIGGSIFILRSLISSFSSYLSRRINCYVHFDITRDLFRHLQSLSLSFFDEHSTGEHIYRINHDVSSVSGFVCNTVPQIVTLFPRLLFILVIVFRLNWRLALFAALLVPVSYVHPYFFGRWLREITRKIISRAQTIFKGLQEAFSHIRLIKAMGREKNETKRFEENLSQRLQFELKSARFSSLSSFSDSILNKVLSGVIALYGGYQVIKGAMTLGTFTAIMLYLAQLLGLLKSIGGLYQTIMVNSVTRQRLAEMLDIKPQISDSKDARPYNIERGKIEFNNVFFGYKKDNFVLKGISFSIAPASKVALVGPSGAGKTTILYLLLRLYEQEKGAIFIDGIDTRKIELYSLKSQIGIALQETFLWDDTIANNILYGAEQVSDEEVIKAARLAKAHDFIISFPDRYDSVIGEMACKISEGQKQRIALARAVINRPKILILDEAMSSVDSETEDEIVDNIRREFRDSTVIVISHRLSTVKKMDLVYFLEDGSTIKTARHEELLERDEKYRKVFASQVIPGS